MTERDIMRQGKLVLRRLRREHGGCRYVLVSLDSMRERNLTRREAELMMWGQAPLALEGGR